MFKLFEEFKINTLILKNRFVMSAAADHLDKDNQARIHRFSELARSNIGLIISGGTILNEIEGWADVIDAIHKNNGKFALQLVTRAGPGSISGFGDVGEDKIAISELPENHIYFKAMQPFVGYGKHHSALEEELMDLINTYAKSAVLAKKIGADAIEIHAAHQSFLSQSLSPLTNIRCDKWGGSVRNRTRLHQEICKAIRSEVGEDFPVLIKLGIQDAIAGGLTFEEGCDAAKLIANYGYDALEISQGLQDFSSWDGTPMRTSIKKVEDEAYFKVLCHKIKQSIPKPTILTGGLRSIELMEQLIQDGTTDCIGMCRPFIREYNLVKRWQGGDLSKARCISCNKCLTELFLKGKPLDCYLDKNVNALHNDD